MADGVIFQGESRESLDTPRGGEEGGDEPPFDDVLGALHQKALNATG